MNHKRRAEKLSIVRAVHSLIVGVDVGKLILWACIMDGLTEQQVCSPFKFQNTRDGFERLLDQLRKTQQRTGVQRVVVAMEPSGHYWKALATFLLSQGITVVCVNPLHVKRAKEFDDNSPTKNDPKDCWVIARRAGDGDFFEPYLPEGVYADLRVLTQVRRQLRVKLNQTQNQLRTLLDEYFPEFSTIFKDPLGLTATFLLRHYPFPVDILAIPVSQLAREMSQASRGRVAMQRTQEIRVAAATSIGVQHGLTAVRLRLGQLLDEVEFWLARMAQTEEAMAAALKATGLAPYLLSVRGVGVVTAASFLGETGDLSRYEDPRQLQKLAGYNLKENSSGQHKGQTRITKRGRPGLRCPCTKLLWS
ncbi:MAG TPA: IS110 family transposase [Symbiobacteriaceae bacterium]|jgi:transposase